MHNRRIGRDRDEVLKIEVHHPIAFLRFFGFFFLTTHSGPARLHQLHGGLNQAVIERADPIALPVVAVLLPHVAEITLLERMTGATATATTIDVTEREAAALMIVIGSEIATVTATVIVKLRNLVIEKKLAKTVPTVKSGRGRLRPSNPTQHIKLS